MDKIALTKERISEMPGVLKSLEMAVLNGEIEPFELLQITASFTKWVDYVKKNKDLQKNLESSYEKHQKANEKEILFNGSKITYSTGRVSYDFSQIENENYKSLCKEFEYYKEQKKVLEDEFINNMKKEPIVNELTGEIISFETPLVSYGESFFSIKL